MAPILLWLVMVLCLLISVVKYVMGVILKLSFPSTRIQKDYTYQPTVSVLMPCFKAFPASSVTGWTASRRTNPRRPASRAAG